ncbi:glycosyltransferase family 4 protein [Acidithiobacillus montserratensis]|uniref:glycosyltransferase family 4 protein n=1 Tax=Acidithiobacillus montserratensis TaxID=2729135 RepID=UPI001C061281|nr:glycosyltransferase family 4 protein [Acidithiobacillaceae bacterium]MBU2746940.1 glycosyltransferase family 4 protein [Acidithiobacillus montserratensis]
MNRFASELRQRAHEVFYLSASDWVHTDHLLFQEIQTKFLLKARGSGLSEILAPALAERFVQGMLAAKIAHDMKVTHIWFQDPWIALGYLRKRKTYFKNSQAPLWGVTEHGLGSSIRAAAYDGLTVNARTLAWTHRLEYHILKKADWVFTPSKVALEQLCRDLGADPCPENWQILGYGTPDPISISRENAREMLGWSDNIDYILTIGRLSPVKRMHDLVAACARIQERRTRPLQLFILGQGDTSLVETTAERYGFHPHILFAEDVQPYLAAADVYLSASTAESFGLANQEAIAAGLPSILACGGASCEVAKTGAWIINGSIDSFSEALLALLRDRTLLRFWAERATQQHWPKWRDIIDECERKLLSRTT